MVAMKKTVYDFSKTIEYIRTTYDPATLSIMLKDAALKLATLDREGTSFITDMQLAVVTVGEFLDSIIETEVEQ